MAYGGNVDEKLIFLIADGDRKALETLYCETKFAVCGFLLSIVLNTHTTKVKVTAASVLK